MSKPNFPDDGIAWHSWCDATLKKIVEKDRPVLLVVPDADATVAPFLVGIMEEAAKNARLRELLHKEFLALFIPVDALPQDLSLFGAGSHYHIGILSPSGLTPIMTFPVQTCGASEVVEQVVVALERLLETW